MLFSTPLDTVSGRKRMTNTAKILKRVEHEWPTNTGLHCPECGNGGDIEGHAIREENPRERGDDDGVEYADPGDELDRRLREDL